MDKQRITIFAGKGGVGKTTCAAATALHHSLSGKKTLAISTDATPSLSHIFEITDNKRPARVRESLYINEIGLQQAKEMWDKKFGREVFEVFSSFVSIDYQEFVDFMTSLLPGLADEFIIDYIRGLSLSCEYDSIVWDTAPLGQTLALLQTPVMLKKHLKMAPRIYSKLKRGQKNREPILDIIARWEKLSTQNMEFLRDGVSFNIVTIPEALAVEQLEGVLGELNRFGFKVEQLIINNVVKNPDSDFLSARVKEQSHYIEFIKDRFSNLNSSELPMFPCELIGLERLKEAEKILFPMVTRNAAL